MISVIIPTYNRATYLGEAIDSVLAQTVWAGRPSSGSFELLIVDDGSTDGTSDIVASFGGRVDYHVQPHAGVSRARNFGLQLARGEYIAFLDSDDLWMKDKIQVQMSYFKALPLTMMCYTEEVWIRNGRRHNPARKHQKYSGWIFDRVLPLCLISLSSAMFRRKVFEDIGGFDETLPACEDYDFGIRLAHRFPVGFITKPLIIKRGGHTDQLSRRYWGMDRFRVQALEKALGLGLGADRERLVKAEIVRKCLVLIHGFEKRRNTGEADRYRELFNRYQAQLQPTK